MQKLFCGAKVRPFYEVSNDFDKKNIEKQEELSYASPQKVIIGPFRDKHKGCKASLAEFYTHYLYNI